MAGRSAGLTLSAAPAEAYPGQLCSAVTTAPFFAYPGGPWQYSVSPGGGVRDESTYYQFYNGTWYHFGHGNGHSNQWFRLYDTTCG